MQQKNCTSEEATREYINQWRDLRSSFRFQTRCTVSMYRRILGKTVIADCVKVVVECVKCNLDTKAHNFTGVRTIQVQYDVREFFSLDPLQKKEKSLELLMEGIQKITKLLQWDLNPFVTAYDEVIHQNYQNHWLWKKVKSPNLKMCAELWVFHEIDAVDLVLVIRDKKGVEISRGFIISDKPDELIFDKYLGVFRWESNSQITLTAKYPDILDGTITGDVWKWSLDL